MRDFTTGSVWKHIFHFSWPLFVGNLFQVLYNTVDSFWVGRYLGPEALGAVSVSFPVAMLLVAAIAGLTMATTALVAQYRGARDEANVRRTVANSLILLVTLGIAATTAGIAWRGPILRLMRTPAEILDMATLYLGIFLVGLVPSFVFNVLSSVLRGLGDSRTPLIFLIAATVSNMILDPIFIIGLGPVPGMGMAGAGWATVTAQALAAILAVRYVMRHTTLISRRRAYWRLDGKLLRQLVSIGVPAALQATLVSSSMLVVASLVNGFGAVVVAAFGAAGRLDQFAFLPAQSIGLAVSALVGQNLGARQYDRVTEVVRAAAVLAFTFNGLMTAIVLWKPDLLVQVFTDDAAVIAEGIRYLQIVGLSYVPIALMMVASGVLQGAGDTLPAMLITLATVWGVRVPLAWFFSYRVGWGPAGTWWAMAVSFVMGMTFQWIYYGTGRWRQKVVVRPQTA